ncbi:MAG: hypothetical protein IPJ01_10410 [Micavibrio sp.]|nr:hypothetical protein [Micavibrio sp.]
MNYYSVFYWLTVADGVKEVFDTFSNIFTFFTVISIIAYAIVIGCSIEYKDDKDSITSILLWRKLIGRFYWMCQIICIITWLGYVFTPTKKDCMLIVAGGAVGNFITTDTSSRAIPADITKFLHLSLNKEIEDLQKEVKTDIRKELGIETQKDKLIQQVEKLTKEQLIEYIKNDTTTTK